jgi:ceramide glucosyltransferase
MLVTLKPSQLHVSPRSAAVQVVGILTTVSRILSGALDSLSTPLHAQRGDRDGTTLAMTPVEPGGVIMRILTITTVGLATAVFLYAFEPHLMIGSAATDLAILEWGNRLFSLPSLLAAAGAIVLALAWRWHSRLASAVAPRGSSDVRLTRYPSVTVIRPVRGRDVGAEDNFRAALDTGYPGEVETLFIFDDDEDPGLPLARKVVREHRAAGRRGTADVLVAGAPPQGRTGKLNAMIIGAARATGELIGFGDSDTRPDRNVLRGVVEALMTTPRAGSAFAPVLVYEPAKYAGDALYGLMQNALYSPLAANAAGTTRTLPFIMGQLMVFTREALDAIGGVATAQGQLVDDMYIGKRVHEVGYRNVMSTRPLHIATGGMTLRQFMPVYRRWMAFSKNGLPLSFTWRQWMTGVTFYGSLILALIAYEAGGFFAALPSLIALGFVGASQLILQRRYGGAPIPARLAWTAWGVFLLAPVIMAGNIFRRQVSWRGRVYTLNRAAGLAPAVVPVRVAANDNSSIDKPTWSQVA